MEANIFLLLLMVTMEIVSGVKQKQRPITYKLWTQYRNLITPGSVMARSNTDDCWEALSLESGQIHSPGFPEEYENNQTCIWQITNPEGSPIVLFFGQPFEMEECCDYLEIWDGRSDTAPRIGKFGPKKPPIIWSTGNHLYIKWYSDYSNTERGFQATFRKDDCGGQLNMESGRIQTPGFPEKNIINHTCIWQITNPEGSPFVLLFNQTIEIGNSTSCNFDYVEIRDGSNDTARMLGKFCGDQKPPIIKSTGNHLWIKFKSDGSNMIKGFEATFRKDCPQIITAIIPGNQQFSGNYVKFIEGGDRKNDSRNYIVYHGVNALNESCIWWNEGNHWWIGSCNSSHGSTGFAYSPNNSASSCPTDYSNSMDWIAADEDIPIDGFMIKEVVYCCYTVNVAFDSVFYDTHGSHLAHPAIYQDYNMEPDLVKGKIHYTSSDGKYALSICGDKWWIQSAVHRGKCAGIAYSSWKTPNCVHYVGHDWKYYVSSVNDFVPAKQGLIVKCASKRW